MPDFLTRRNGTWHFVRRVPVEFATYDRRGIIKHSTKVRVASDRTGRRATRVADRLNAELEAYWRQIAGGTADAAASAYEDARRRARSVGFEYAEADQIVQFPWEKRIERIEALITRNLENDAGARAAILGTASRPSFPLSRLIEEYEEIKRVEIQKFSRNQLRVWRGRRKRVALEFIEIVGDKHVTELTNSGGVAPDECD